MINLFTLASKLVKIKGEPLQTKDYVLFEPFYNSKAPQLMIKAGRQIGKSVSLAVKQVIRACLKKYSSSLTLMPFKSHINRFSRLYIDDILKGSDDLKTRVGKNLINNVSLKELNNGSILHFYNISDSPGRIRGVSVRDMYWDEMQDIPLKFLDIAEQCTSHFEDARFSYTGTPKTLDNPMEFLWRKSSMHEPFITCSACHHDNYCLLPDVYKMFEPQGIVCQKCRKKINLEDVYNVQYNIMKPESLGTFDGLHIPQIFVPYNLSEKRWRKIMRDYKDMGQFEFATEVLGISFDTGGRPITLEKLKQCCISDHHFGTCSLTNYPCKVMGVDWGYATTRSLTVACVIGVRFDGKYEVLWAKKFHYRDRIDQIAELLKIYEQYQCNAVGLDSGVGLLDNQEWRMAVGADSVYEFSYCSPNKILSFNKENLLYATNRAKTINLLFSDLNKQHILFPCFEDSSDFFDDLLSVVEEVRETSFGRNKYYTRNPMIPDDFTHSLNFGLLALKLITQENILCSIISSEEDRVKNLLRMNIL